ncbi:MAG: prepilin-type N-terminal cleavage/methylation domain-containing protein [Fimbriimonadaceae bacterium]|nr:prepilin-type N-terminal cleavage/methylation domain-containing protein [Fimbriimonadaceae bacterium]QYK55690.1 MAG: prepilin-type N-terminal cleavage/methylation domain-containing protein [Fimbriimonadaceae bacterium]
MVSPTDTRRLFRRTFGRVFRVGRKRGFTLIESAVALFVFVAGLLTTFGAMGVSQMVGRQAEVRNIAHSLARQKIEVLRSLDFSVRKETVDEEFALAPDIMKTAQEKVQGLQMRGRYTVTLVGSTGTLHQITVKVQWRNAGSQVAYDKPWSEVLLTTLATRQPVQQTPQPTEGEMETDKRGTSSPTGGQVGTR